MRRFSLPVVRTLARDMVRRLAWIAAQDETYAERFRRLGAPADRVHVAGSLKYDTAVVADRIPGDIELAEALGLRSDAPLIVAGSTGPGEESLLIDAFEMLRRRDLEIQLAIVPRKPERFDEVARLIESRGFACRRRSLCPDGTTHAANSSDEMPIIFLGDTMGELRKFYALAATVFVGRTLVPLGGSDLMEVAALAKPMCYGPHVDNFADIDRQLLESDAAVKVENVDQLVESLEKFSNDTTFASDMGERARQVVIRNQGATRGIVSLIERALGADGESRARSSRSNDR